MTLEGRALERNPYGFYSEMPSPIEMTGTPQTVRSYQWKHGDQDVHAKINVRAKEVASLIPESDSTDYGSLWKDGKLVGTVIAGTNLKGDAAAVMDEYVAYYRAKGFRFDTPVHEIADLPKFLKQKVESGELDY